MPFTGEWKNAHGEIPVQEYVPLKKLDPATDRITLSELLKSMTPDGLNHAVNHHGHPSRLGRINGEPFYSRSAHLAWRADKIVEFTGMGFKVK
jgi:hypothetical protein